MRIPSWKWLSRPATQSAGGLVLSRPCLPAIEKLDDRVMLSASVGGTDASNEGGPPSGDDQILIGLLRGQLNLVGQEVNDIKLAGDLKLDVHKLTESFLKIDDVIYKLGGDQIKGDLTAKKIDQAISDLKVEFLKIDALVGGLPAGEDGSLRVLVDNLDTFKLNAESLVDQLGAATNGGDASQKVQVAMLKITQDFDRLDASILKLDEDLVAAKGKGGGKVNLHDIQITRKIDKASASLSEPVQNDLTGELAARNELIGSLASSPSFGGGIIVETVVDDVIA